MKIKTFIYLLFIVSGAILIGISSNYEPKEYPMSLGFVLLMFGVYKTTQLYSSAIRENNKENEEDEI